MNRDTLGYIKYMQISDCKFVGVILSTNWYTQFIIAILMMDIIVISNVNKH